MDNPSSRFEHLFATRPEDGNFIFQVEGQSQQDQVDIPAHSLIIKYYLAPKFITETPLRLSSTSSDVVIDFIKLCYTILTPDDLKTKDRILGLYSFSAQYGNQRLDNIIWPKMEALVNSRDASKNWIVEDWENVIRAVKGGVKDGPVESEAHLDTIITAICKQFRDKVEVRRKLLKLTLFEDQNLENSLNSSLVTIKRNINSPDPDAAGRIENGIFPDFVETSDASTVESEASTVLANDSTISMPDLDESCLLDGNWVEVTLTYPPEGQNADVTQPLVPNPDHEEANLESPSTTSKASPSKLRRRSPIPNRDPKTPNRGQATLNGTTTPNHCPATTKSNPETPKKRVSEPLNQEPATPNRLPATPKPSPVTPKRGTSPMKKVGVKRQKSSTSTENRHVYLEASNIVAQGVSGWCRLIDTDKWTTLVEAQPPATTLHLPEGKFSFPARFRLEASGHTICGAKNGTTELCWQTSAEKKTVDNVVFHLGNNVTLQNLSIRVSPLEDEKLWPYIVLDKGSCCIKNASLFGCGIYIKSNTNIVEDVRIFGNKLATGKESAKSRKPTISVNKNSIGIKLRHDATNKKQRDGQEFNFNMLTNISITETHLGIFKEIKWAEVPEPVFQARMDTLTFKNVKYGVTLHSCCGDKIEGIKYEWRMSSLGPTPTAVRLNGGEKNEIDKVTCSGTGKFTGVCLHLGKEGAPRENVASNVTGALCWLYGFTDVKGFGENKFLHCYEKND